MTVKYTPHFRFSIPDFLSSPWHAGWEAAMRAVDQALYGVLLSGALSLWVNARDYLVGDLVISPDDGQIWKAEESHTSSASPQTFAQEVAAYPSRWSQFVWAAQETVSYDIVTANNITVTPTQRLIIINKPAPAPTAIALCSVFDRGGRPLTILDWAGNAGDIVLTPFGAETVMGKSLPDRTWTIASSGGFGAGGKIELEPITTLNGWAVRVG